MPTIIYAESREHRTYCDRYDPDGPQAAAMQIKDQWCIATTDETGPAPARPSDLFVMLADYIVELESDSAGGGGFCLEAAGMFYRTNHRPPPFGVDPERGLVAWAISGEDALARCLDSLRDVELLGATVTVLAADRHADLPEHEENDDYGMLLGETGEFLRPATREDRARSLDAGRLDGGSGAIEVDGRTCYVAD